MTPRRGGFATVWQALEQIRVDRAIGARIDVDTGVFREKTVIDVPGVTIVGRGAGSVIKYDAGAALSKPAGGNWGTSGSATLTITAPDVRLARLTVRNAHDYRANRMQAVALAVFAGGERTRVDNCAIESWQDTLLIQAPTLIRGGRVAGRVDFVFGGGAAWIERCRIVSRDDGGMPGGFVAAPSTPAAQSAGLVFASCRLERERGVPDGTTFLGRPWRAGGNMALLGQATFLRCWMDVHIARDGWTGMRFRGRDGAARALEPEERDCSNLAARAPAPRRRADDGAALMRRWPTR